MSSSTTPPSGSVGGGSVGGGSLGGASAAGPSDQIHAAHDTYPKGELSSIGELVGDITKDMSTLMRQEVALAKAEVKESAKNAGAGAGMLSGAAVAGHFVLLFLSIALWWWLGTLMENDQGEANRSLAALIVAVLWAIIAAVLAAMGRSKLKQVQGMPQTVETAKAVPDALKGNE